MLALRGIAVWMLIVLVESLHGTARRLWMEPSLGDLPARQISVFTGSVLIFLIALATVRWLQARRAAQLLEVGTLWLVLTLAFELLLGRLVLGASCQRLGEDYDLPHGGLMPLGLLFMMLAPLLAAKIRRLL